ncbi:MAG: ABC transporter substrate-binding protein [Turicibacter sp.]|nr:ABC transporter substrate-binding protein [Turicibacter sp.]
MKKVLRSSLMAAILAVLAACGNAPTTEVVQSGRNTISMVDPLGNNIEVLENAETIVSLAPAITQVLIDLGAADRIVVVDTWTAGQMDGFDQLPQLDMMAPDMETLLALAPELVLAGEVSFGMDGDIFQPLMDAGIAVAQIPTSNSIQAIKEDVQFIADVVGLHDEGAMLLDDMQSAIDEITSLTQDVEEPKRVLFEISPLPDIFSFGTGTFLNEMLELAGAVNVFSDQQGWLPVTEEAAVAANPDVILTNVDFLEDPVSEILGRSGWTHVAAIENGAVHYVDNGYTSLPNHRIVNGLREMAKAIHPETFQSLGE